jgi:hypothetical protein
MTLRVTDHALVRFLERAGGLDVEGLRAALSRSLTRSAEAAARIGASEYVITADGCSYIVKNNAVVTVTTGAFDPTRRGGL